MYSVLINGEKAQAFIEEEKIKELGVVLPAYQELEENTVEPEGNEN